MPAEVPSAAHADPVQVVAGALVDARGRVLIAQRPAGKAMAGRWEFPGGKRLPHETARDALNRELLEELGIQISRARPLIEVTHRYPEALRAVHIDCWLVEGWRGEIAPLDGQSLRWCEREELAGADILEADRPIVTALRLPPVFVRVADAQELAERLPGIRGRERVAWLLDAPPADVSIPRRLREHGDWLFLLDPCAPPPGGFGRVYTQSHAIVRGDTEDARAEPVGRLVHSAAEAAEALGAGADFLLVPDRTLAHAELRGLAAAGLPYYLNVAAPSAGPDVPAATGKLWWKRGVGMGRR